MKNSLDLKDDKLFFSGIAPNYNNQEIATNGTYQPNNNGASNFIVQFNQNGTRNWGTYNGNYSGSTSTPSNSFVLADKNSNSFYNYGSTGMQSNIATTDGYLTTTNSPYSGDAFVCKFTDQNTKSWGTYYGGELDEKDIDFHPYNGANKFYIVGSTQSLTQMSTPTSLQPVKQVFDLVNNTQQSAYSIFITHFEPNPLSTESFNSNSFSIYPNPNNGEFNVKFNSSKFANSTLEIFDVLGKKLHIQTLANDETTIKTENFAKGIYLVNLTQENQTITTKIIVE
jgi:hypothetical protein